MKFNTIQDLKSFEGEKIGASEWKLVTQETINDFAKATGDYQWIHTDPQRATKESPFKKTIAHGFWALSLAPGIIMELLDVKSVKMFMNYGTNKVRFTAPVICDSEIRMTMRLEKLEPARQGFKAFLNCVFEIKNYDKPACVAEVVAIMFE